MFAFVHVFETWWFSSRQASRWAVAAGDKRDRRVAIHSCPHFLARGAAVPMRPFSLPKKCFPTLPVLASMDMFPSGGSVAI